MMTRRRHGDNVIMIVLGNAKIVSSIGPWTTSTALAIWPDTSKISGALAPTFKNRNAADETPIGASKSVRKRNELIDDGLCATGIEFARAELSTGFVNESARLRSDKNCWHMSAASDLLSLGTIQQSVKTFAAVCR